MKKREFPFPDNRVFVDSLVPDPLVFFIESEETKSDGIREIARYLPATDFQQKFPPNHDSYSLNDLLDAGVDLRMTNPRILESNDPTDYPSQSDLLSSYENIKKQVESKQAE